MPQTTTNDAPAAAFAGLRGDGAPHYARSKVSEEASAEIPFGVMVGAGSADDGCLALAAVTDKLAGVVVHSHAYNKDNELGSTGLKPDVTVSVLRKGTIWDDVEEAVAVGGTVLVRAVATGGEQAGEFRTTADASDLIDISANASWLTSTSGAGLALLSIDLP